MESWSGTLTCTRPSGTVNVQNLKLWSESLVSPHSSCPLTFSATGYWWESLVRHMPRYEEWKAANTDGKIKIARDNIRDKAQIVAYHYITRFTALMENANMPKFRIVDYYDHYQLQARSSPHNHGFVWIEGRPKLDLNNIAFFAQQWGMHVSADTLGVFHQAPPDKQPLMLLRHEQQGLDFSNLAQLLQRAQLQKCSNAYCLFAAPTFLTISEIRDQPVVIKNPQRSAAHLMFYPECNDPHLNRYNRIMSLGWLANTDITPRTALQALLNYLSEYCTKAGVKVPQYWDMLRATQGFELTPIPIFNREADEQAHR
ncbi:hypothetical protein D6D17_10197 [Aureobasidium pullulans]|nr:hypothetical protein D6D17_10197 [Aureobasidium pullulans]